jgi:hypothetical protein
VECYVNGVILPALAGKMLGTVYPTGLPASLPKSARTSEILIQMIIADLGRDGEGLNYF